MLQDFVLPYDVMKHFGYSAATIFPYEDINHNIAYIRIMSSLRGANPLGAYMVMILSLLAALLVRRRTKTLSKWKYSAALVLFILLLGAVVLILTFSRSAWVGLAVSMAALLWVSIRAQRTRLAVLVGAAVVVVGGAGAVCGLRNDTTFQNIFFHTQTNSVVKTTSNEGHVAAFRTGIDDIVREPFGRGPGTAGPASLYNTGHPGRIAENYFLQIGQETGWIGLAVFVMINVLIARSLWRRRDDALAAGLLASLIGISCIGLFSHVWAVDTLAYIWWGLAALAYATRLPHLDDISKM